MTIYPPWYIPPQGVDPPLTVSPPDSGAPPGWPGYNPAASPSPSPSPSPTPSASISDTTAPLTPAINFPPPSLPIIDAKGNMNPAWYQVFLTLFRRSGGVQPTSETSEATNFTLGAERGFIGQLDALRQEVAALRAEVALARQPRMKPTAEIYALMRR